MLFFVTAGFAGYCLVPLFRKFDGLCCSPKFLGPDNRCIHVVQRGSSIYNQIVDWRQSHSASVKRDWRGLFPANLSIRVCGRCTEYSILLMTLQGSRDFLASSAGRLFPRELHRQVRNCFKN